MLLLCAALSLVGCSWAGELAEDSSLYVNTRGLVDALITSDAEAAYAIMQESVTREEFDSAYPALAEAFSGVSEYKLIVTSYKTARSDSSEVRSASFAFIAEGKNELILTAVEYDGKVGLAGFNVHPAATGTLGTFKKSEPLQKAFILFNVPILLFTFWAFVDCARTKTEKKALWLILIAIGLISFSLNFTDSGFGYTVGIGYFGNYFALLKQGTAMVIRLVIPLPAIIWLVMRRRLRIDDKKSVQDENS